MNHRILLTMLCGLALLAPSGAALGEEEEGAGAPADVEQFNADGYRIVDEPGAKDHPAVKRFPGSFIYNQVSREFEAFDFPIKSGEKVHAEGRFFRAEYEFPRRAGCTQILGNYEAAFKKEGMKLYKGSDLAAEDAQQANDEVSINAAGHRWVTGIGKTRSGAPLHIIQTCAEFNGGANVQGVLVVVEGAALKQEVEVTSDFLAEEIEKNGRVAVQIQFATGKAEISPESAKMLEEIGKLLSAKSWKLRIEGHTDNVGQSKANLDLSKKRAQSVKEWLVAKHKVDGGRLTTEGFGDTRPVADNKTEEGRAQNRRVELVKL